MDPEADRCSCGATGSTARPQQRGQGVVGHVAGDLAGAAERAPRGGRGRRRGPRARRRAGPTRSARRPAGSASSAVQDALVPLARVEEPQDGDGLERCSGGSVAGPSGGRTAGRARRGGRPRTGRRRRRPPAGAPRGGWRRRRRPPPPPSAGRPRPGGRWLTGTVAGLGQVVQGQHQRARRGQRDDDVGGLLGVRPNSLSVTCTRTGPGGAPRSAAQERRRTSGRPASRSRCTGRRRHVVAQRLRLGQRRRGDPVLGRADDAGTVVRGPRGVGQRRSRGSAAASACRARPASATPGWSRYQRRCAVADLVVGDLAVRRRSSRARAALAGQAQGVEDLRQDRGVDAVEQGAAGVGDVGGQPGRGQHPAGQPARTSLPGWLTVWVAPRAGAQQQVATSAPSRGAPARRCSSRTDRSRTARTASAEGTSGSGGAPGGQGQGPQVVVRHERRLARPPASGRSPGTGAAPPSA